MQILKNTGTNWRKRRLIGKFYMGQNVKIRVGQGDTRGVKTGRGVRQGHCFRRFSSSYVMQRYRAKEAVAGTGDFKIGGKLIRFVKYAYDLLLLANKESAVQ